MKKYLFYGGSVLLGLILPLTALNPFMDKGLAPIQLPVSNALKTMNQEKDERPTNEQPLQTRGDSDASADGTDRKGSTDRSRSARSNLATPQQDSTATSAGAKDVSQAQLRDRFTRLATLRCIANHRAMNLREDPRLDAENIVLVIPCGKTVEVSEPAIIVENAGIRWVKVEYQGTIGWIANVAFGGLI